MKTRLTKPWLALALCGLLLLALGCPSHPSPPTEADGGGQDASPGDGAANDGSPADGAASDSGEDGGTGDAAPGATLMDAGPGDAGTVDASAEDGGGDAQAATVTVSGPNGSSAEVPAGAIDAGTIVAISTATTGYPALPFAVQTLGQVYDFTPNGAAFAVPVTVTIPFTAVADSGAPTLYTAEPGGSWTAVAGASVSAGAMHASVTHFSYFVVAYVVPAWVDVSGSVSHYGSAPYILPWNGYAIAAGAGDDAGSPVYESSSFGSSTWTSDVAGLPTGTEVRSLAGDANAIYAATSNGIYKSVPGSSSWASISTGLPAGMSTVASYNGTLYAGTEIQGTRMFTSTNGGSSWTASDTGLQEAESFLTSLTTIVNGVPLTNGGGNLWYTANGGASWTESAFDAGSMVESVALCNGTWFIGADGGLYSSTSLDTAFTQVTTIPALTGNGPNIGVYSVLCVGTRLYIGIEMSGFAYSDDNGATFKSYLTGLPTAANGIYPDGIRLTYQNGVLLAAVAETWLNSNAGYLYAAPQP